MDIACPTWHIAGVRKPIPDYPEGSSTERKPGDRLVYIDHTGVKRYAPAEAKPTTKKEQKDK